MVDSLKTSTIRGKSGWRRSVGAIPLAVGSIFVLQAAERVLLQTLPTGWYHVVTSLTEASVILCVLFLYLQWRDQAKVTAEHCRRLLHLEQVREETTGMLVHDLRNQLTVLGGTLLILGSDGKLSSVLDESHREMLASAANAQRRLCALLDKVIDVSSEGPGRPSQTDLVN